MIEVIFYWLNAIFSKDNLSIIITNLDSINKGGFKTCNVTNNIEIKVDEKGVVVKDDNGNNWFKQYIFLYLFLKYIDLLIL